MKRFSEYFHEDILNRVTPRLVATLASLFLFGFYPAQADDTPSPQDSFTYTLVGIARIDGVAYASFIDPTSKKSFLLSPGQSGDGWKLISVGSAADPTWPKAVIQKNGESVQFVVEASASKDTSPPMPFYSTQLVVNSPFGLIGADLTQPPQPPVGAKLPLVFQAVDLQKLDLNDEQKQGIIQLRHDFLNALNGPTAHGSSSSSTGSAASNSTVNNTTSTSSTANDQASPVTTTNNQSQNVQYATTPAQQQNNWQTAQQQSDEVLRTTLGWDGFNRYQMALAN